MSGLEAYLEQSPGFNFENHTRNLMFQNRKLDAKDPQATSSVTPNFKFLKTGTTICGVVYKNGVVLGADTRATSGYIVADKDCDKLHKISDNIYAAGAGTAADLNHTCDWLSTQVELHRLATSSTPRVSMAVCVMSQELFKYQGYKGCALVLGGVDCKGPVLYKIHPHGSTDRSDYAAMGSGSLNAMAVLENQFKDNMEEEEAKELVAAAIRAGILNDLGSGGFVDIVVIKFGETKTGISTDKKDIVTERTRHFKSPVRHGQMPQFKRYSIGTTPFFKEHIQDIAHCIDIVSEDVEMIDVS